VNMVMNMDAEGTGCELDACDTGCSPVAGSCEHCNDHSLL